VAPRLARNTIIDSTFEVGCRWRCTMRVDCGQLDPGAVIRPVRGERHPQMPESLQMYPISIQPTATAAKGRRRSGRRAVHRPSPASEKIA